MDRSGTARGLLRSGSAATTAQLARVLAIQVTHIVVRRLVPPDEWGVWLWLEPVFLVLATLRDLGVPTHVVRLRPAPLGTLLRFELLWGALLGGAVVVSAPWLVLLYENPGPAVVLGLRVLVVYFLFEGISAVAIAGFESRLAIERTLGADLLRTFTYCAVVLAASFSGYGFWSFVAAQVTAQAVFAAALWWRGRRELELWHAPGSVRPLVVASLPVGLIWVLTTAVTYVDFLIVGGLFDRAHLGLYGTGYAYAFLVFRVLREPFGRSLYPAFVDFRDDPRQQFRAYRLGTVLFLLLEVPAALFLALNATLVIRVVGGADYAGAAPYLALLAFAPIVDPLSRFGGEYLMARHLDRARIVSLVLHLAALVGGGILLCRWLASPFGMAWANFLPLGAPVILWALWKAVDRGEIVRMARELSEAYLVPIVPFGLAWWLSGDDVWLRLLASSTAVALCLAWSWRRHAAEFRSFFAGPVSDRAPG